MPRFDKVEVKRKGPWSNIAHGSRKKKSVEVLDDRKAATIFFLFFFFFFWAVLRSF